MAFPKTCPIKLLCVSVSVWPQQEKAFAHQDLLLCFGQSVLHFLRIGKHLSQFSCVVLSPLYKSNALVNAASTTQQTNAASLGVKWPLSGATESQKRKKTRLWPALTLWICSCCLNLLLVHHQMNQMTFPTRQAFSANCSTLFGCHLLLFATTDRNKQRQLVGGKHLLLRCLGKRREVELELQWFQA